MVEALKKLDKKFIIIAASIILLPIVVIIFLAIIQGCSGKITYETYQEKMISAAEKYITEKEKIPTSEGEITKVKLEKLVNGGYIKSTEKLLDDPTCEGSVVVRRNGSSIESTAGGFLNYTVDLVCDSYKTIHLVDKIKENIVTEESGLYAVGEEYIFKGIKPKNYITFFGHEYRIMSVDKNGILRLIKSNSEIASRVWDNKFNVDIGYSYGKNIYKDSAILTYLIKDYENPKKINKQAKHHVMAYDVCIGKRKNNDYSISKELDCSEKLPKQVISLMNVSDFALASTDPDCNSVIGRSCKNYNYLSNIAFSGWTSNVSSDNTYEVFNITGGLLTYQKGSAFNEYNIVIYIDGNELYTEGTGSQADPFVIK